MNKYRNKITKIDGIKFRSKKEANRYSELKLLKSAGHVIDFKMQVPYIIAEYSNTKIKYYLDFLVHWNTGELTYEDTKGIRTSLYKLKKLLMAEKHGIIITEI